MNGANGRVYVVGTRQGRPLSPEEVRRVVPGCHGELADFIGTGSETGRQGAADTMLQDAHAVAMLLMVAAEEDAQDCLPAPCLERAAYLVASYIDSARTLLDQDPPEDVARPTA